VTALQASRSQSTWRVVGVAVVALTAALLCMPFLRSVTWLGDEGILLDGADRMLRGEHLYSDFFEFHPPGGFLIVEGWFRLAGQSFIAARILATLTITGIACFVYLSCHEASKHVVISAVAALAWVIWSQLAWSLQISHHWFTTLFSMISAWAALRNIRSGIASNSVPIVSGLAAGAAAMITPTRGALTALASLTAFLGSSSTRLVFFKFAASCAVIPILLCFFLVGRGSFGAAFADVIIFSATQYSSIQGVPFAYGGSRSNPLKYIHSINALMIVLVCVLCWPSALRDRTLWTSVALALAGVLGAYPRPDIAHIAFSLPLSLPLAAYCTAVIADRSSRVFVYLTAAIAFLFCVPSTIHFFQAARQSLSAKLTRTPRGEVALLEDGASELVDHLNSEAGTYFFYPYIPMLPYLTANNQVSKYDVFVPYYTTEEQYRETCNNVMEEASLIVVNTNWVDQVFLRKIFPAMKNEKDVYKEEFDEVLRSWFTLAWQADHSKSSAEPPNHPKALVLRCGNPNVWLNLPYNIYKSLQVNKRINLHQNQPQDGSHHSIAASFVGPLIRTILIAGLTLGASRGAQAAWRLVWSDEFNGSSVNTKHWGFDIGNGGNGWGNHELEYYTSRPENVFVRHGLLHIVARREFYHGFQLHLRQA
jgi:hypothetical protein